MELPKCAKPNFKSVLEKYKTIFCTIPGKTNEGYHFIPTTGNPVKIPPRRIPAHYRTEITEQIHEVKAHGWPQQFLYLKELTRYAYALTTWN